MNALPNLNLQYASLDGPVQGHHKTAQDVGNSLFQDLLKKTVRLSEGTPLCNPQHLQSPRQTMLRSADQLLRRTGLRLGNMTLQGSAKDKLIALLKKQGFPMEEIHQILQFAMDPNGDLHMDRLMTRLMHGLGVEPNSSDHYAVPSDRIPQVQETLSKMGLGVGEIKETIEKSINYQGELSPARLAKGLAKFFHGTLSENDMIHILGRFGIKSRPTTIMRVATDPDMEQAFETFTQSAGRDVQQKIKETIAALLQKQGIPPQDVKRFLETLTVDHARVILNKADLVKPDANGGKAEGELQDLLNRVVIKPKPEATDRAWQEKILNLLQKKRVVLSDESARLPLQEKGAFRLNLAELLKQGEQAMKAPSHQTIFQLKAHRVKKTVLHQHNPLEARIQNPQTVKTGFQVKDGIGLDIPMTRGPREIFEGPAVTPSKNPIPVPDPIPKVLDRMIWMVQAGKQESRIMMSPPELGRLDLNLVIKHGHLQANMSAETLVAKEMIEANLSQLRQQLNNLGIVVDRFEVGVGLEDRRFADGDPRMGNKRKDTSPGRSSNHEETPTAAAAETGSGHPDLYQIDVHV